MKTGLDHLVVKMSLLAGIVLTLMIACAVCEDITVETRLGNITGEVEEIIFDGSKYNVTKFLGVPFAEPPTGTRRFNRPIQKGKFSDDFIAKSMPPQCVQNWLHLKALEIDPSTLRQEEDCLYLNIFVPGDGPLDKDQKRAVMIWIYGGGFQIGFQDAYDGKVLVGLNDVILVTINYRVSLLGFLSTAEDNRSGNYGLWDQHMAIKWVHNHIENFGGDPLKVTIFGESAGGGSVIYQALYEGNDGLFQRVIAQSGSANNPWAYDTNPGGAYHNFANKSGCLNITMPTMDVIECLRKLTIDDITEIVEYTDMFWPVKDGEFVKVHPAEIFQNESNEAWDILKRFGKLDLILGVTSSEGGIYIPIIDLLTNTNKTSQPTGYSRDMFETIIVPYALIAAKLKQSRTRQNAVIHQYTDWSDPENTQKVFENTVDLFSDLEFNNGIIKTAMVHSDSGENGGFFFYVFDHKSVQSDIRLSGATHAEELPFVFGFPSTFANLFSPNNRTIPQMEIELSKKIMKYWSTFAKIGVPDIDGKTTWPEYNTMTQKYIRFRANVSSFPVEDHFAAGRMNFWHSLFPTLGEECDKECPKCENDKVSSSPTNNALFPLIVVMIISIWI